MGIEQQKADLKLKLHSRGFIPLQDEYLSSVMDVRAAKRNATPSTEARRIDYRRTFSQGAGKKIFSTSYFGAEYVLLLLCLTASLLLLPLILPPLPPPPFMLLLLPICIMAVLMLLAFMPSSNVRDAATAANLTHL